MGPALTPAEARVLPDPDGHVGPDALLAAARLLLATGALRAEPRDEKRWWGTDRRLCLSVPDGRTPRAPHLLALRDALAEAAQKGPCLAPTEILHHLQKAFGVGYGGFLDAVRADLEERGLVHRTEHRTLGIRRRRWERTGPGESALAALEGRLAEARTIPELLGHDPARAAAVAVGLGGLLLAFDELRPHYPELAEALRRHGEDRADTTWLSTLDAGGTALGVASETGLIDGLTDTLTDGLSGALDALDALGSAFDVGFDGGSADGGDGGGGD
jgi:hypothetical protein